MKPQSNFKFNNQRIIDNSNEIDFSDSRINKTESLNIAKLNREFRKFLDVGDHKSAQQYINAYGTSVIIEKYVIEPTDGEGGNVILKELVAYLVNQFGPYIDLNWIDVSKVSKMSTLFYKLSFNGDISQWDVSNVEFMNSMFESSNFDGDISQWDVSKVKDMSYMFSTSCFNNDISNWDVSNVKAFDGMFCESLFDKDISSWNISNAKQMFQMFEKSEFNQDISQWDVSNVEDMGYMFAGSDFNQNISKWKIKKKCNIESMFTHCPIIETNKPKFVRNKKHIDEAQSGFKFNNATNNSYIDFDDAKIKTANSLNIQELNNKFKQFLNDKDFVSAQEYIETYGTDIISEKYKVDAFNDLIYIIDVISNNVGANVNLNWIDVSKITDMHLLFYKSSFNGDISEWDVSNVTDMSNMFERAKFNGDISNWDVSKVENMQYMFTGSDFNGDISNWDVSNVKDMFAMFKGAKFNQDLSKWNISTKCDIFSMFENCPIIKEYKPNRVHKKYMSENMQSSFKFSNAQKADDSSIVDFNDAKINNAESLNLSKLHNDFIEASMKNLEKANYLYELYGRKIIEPFICTPNSYTELRNILEFFDKDEFANFDLNQINISNVSYATSLFLNLEHFNCDISKWNVSHIHDMMGMFENCYAFNQNLNNWKISKEVISFEGTFQNCKSFNQPLDKWDISHVQVLSDMFMGCTNFNQPLDAWKDKLKNVYTVEQMFEGCENFNQDLSSWRFDKSVSLYHMFNKSNQNISFYPKTTLDKYF